MHYIVLFTIVYGLKSCLYFIRPCAAVCSCLINWGRSLMNPFILHTKYVMTQDYNCMTVLQKHDVIVCTWTKTQDYSCELHQYSISLFDVRHWKGSIVLTNCFGLPKAWIWYPLSCFKNFGGQHKPFCSLLLCETVQSKAQHFYVSRVDVYLND